MLRALFLITLSFSFLTTPAGAAILAQAGFYTLGPSGAPTSICEQGTFGDSFAAASCGAGSDQGGGRARTSYGSLEAYAEMSSGETAPNNVDYQAFGQSMFSDIITMDSPLLTPGIGTFVNISLNVEGNIVRSGPDIGEPGSLFAFWDLRLTVNGVEQESNNPTVFGPRIYSITMFPGSPILLLAELTARIQCFDCGVPYSAVVDLFGTAEITSLEVEGLSPGDYTFTSGDNQHYANVVPEPRAALLISVGLLGLGVRAQAGRSWLRA